MNRLLGVLVFSLVMFFSIGVDATERIDEIPMYGGFDRSTKKKLKKADEQLVRDTTKQFGSKRLAKYNYSSRRAKAMMKPFYNDIVNGHQDYERNEKSDQSSALA